MIKFITSSAEKSNYNGHVRFNNPINIYWVNSIEKSEYEYYGHKNYRIYFSGIGKEWVYDDEDLRDKDYEKILKNFS